MRWDSDTGGGIGAPTAGRRGRARTRLGRTRRGGGPQLFALFFLSIVLLILSRLDYDVLRKARDGFADLAAPVLEAASMPAVRARHGLETLASYVESYGAVYAELERLKEDNERLKHWEWQAKRLERRIGHMRALLNAVEEPALAFTTARVIAEARGPFVRSALLNAGQQQGVKPGYAVISADGVVGRVVHVGETAARVVLLNDLNSRIPVLVGPAAVRAVLAGDNAGQPRLEFLSDAANVYAGDEVYTSGDDGLLPRGLRIGTVEGDALDGFAVRPHAKLDELDYVSVLFFDTPTVPATGQAIHVEAAAPARQSAASGAPGSAAGQGAAP